MNQFQVKRFFLPLRRAYRTVQSPAPPYRGKAMFVWIPKTAGTSLHDALVQIGMQKFKSYDKSRWLFRQRGLTTFVHMAPTDLYARGIIRNSFWNESFKFTFVRNPYDRAVSLFHYLQKQGRVPAGVSFASFLETLEKNWQLHKNMPIPEPSTLPDRLRYAGELLSDDSTLYPPGPYNVFGWNQCCPQARWLTSIDTSSDQFFLGRFETLSEDFERLKAQLLAYSLEPDSLRQRIKDLSMPASNTSAGRGSTTEYFRDRECKKIVERVYAEDFNRFAY